jgi:hypothetical protein
MTTISMPTSPGFISSRFGLRANTQSFESPLTRSVQTVEMTGARWMASYTLPPMLPNTENADKWQAFLLQCAGMAGRLYFFDPDKRTPRGIATGVPLVMGGSQTGRSLITDGWTAGQTGIMKAGDYFQVGTELHRVVADCNSNGSGQATLTFEPPLRDSPSDNAPLTVTNPLAIGRLVGDEEAQWDAGVKRYEPMTFSVIESFS